MMNLTSPPRSHATHKRSADLVQRGSYGVDRQKHLRQIQQQPHTSHEDVTQPSPSRRTAAAAPNEPFIKAFKELDKPAALAAIAREIWADAVESDRAVTEPERLLRFLLLTFADLKKSAFLHWFAFPSLGTQALFRLRSSRPASAATPPPSVTATGPAAALEGPAAAASVVRGLAELWGRSVESTGRPSCPPFFVVVKAPPPQVDAGENAGSVDEGGDASAPAGLRVLSLLEFDLERKKKSAGGAEGGLDGDHEALLFGFIDPSSEPGAMPGWPLRNFLALLSARWGVRRASVLCFREHVPRASSAATGGSTVGGEFAGLRCPFWTCTGDRKSVKVSRCGRPFSAREGRVTGVFWGVVWVGIYETLLALLVVFCSCFWPWAA